MSPFTFKLTTARGSDRRRYPCPVTSRGRRWLSGNQWITVGDADSIGYCPVPQSASPSVTNGTELPKKTCHGNWCPGEFKSKRCTCLHSQHKHHQHICWAHTAAELFFLGTSSEYSTAEDSTPETQAACIMQCGGQQYATGQ